MIGRREEKGTFRMKKWLLFLCFLWLPGMALGADIVIDRDIQDAGFQRWLMGQPYAHNGVIAEQDIPYVTEMHIASGNLMRSLEGVELFPFLERLTCSGIGLAELPNSLPPKLRFLDCSSNSLSILPDALPSTLEVLLCGNNNLTRLPDYSGQKWLEELDCSGNRLLSLTAEYLPQDMRYLACADIGLTELPELSGFQYLEVLDCNTNRLSFLPELPPTLERLFCYKNQLTSLPRLPERLQTLFCENNQLTYLPYLPETLTELICGRNHLTYLPELPAFLKDFQCGNNQLAKIDLSKLPRDLYFLGNGQKPVVTVYGNEQDGYSAHFPMSRPDFRPLSGGDPTEGIRYDTDGETVYLDDTSLSFVPFRGNTGHPTASLFLGELDLRFLETMPYAESELEYIFGWAGVGIYLLVGGIIGACAYKAGKKQERERE